MVISTIDRNTTSRIKRGKMRIQVKEIVGYKFLFALSGTDGYAHQPYYIHTISTIHLRTINFFQRVRSLRTFTRDW